VHDHQAVQITRFTEAGDIAAHLRCLSAEAVPLCRGRYAGTLATIDLGGLRVEILRSRPMLMIGAPTAGWAGLVLMLEGAAAARWSGAAIEAGDVALFGKGRHHEGRYLEPFACAFLGFATTPREGREQPLALPAATDASDDRLPARLRARPVAHAAMAATVRALEDAAATTPSALCEPAARRSLRATVLDAARDLQAPPPPPPARGGGERPQDRSGPSRQRIVHEADAYLRAHPARPVYTEELCATLGVSPTRLHQAFHATFGVSPHRYLKMRRMSMARAALLSRAGPWHSVKAAALSHGFWHLGQFAHDYRVLYGECPSDTLARAVPSAGAADDRNDGPRGAAAAPLADVA
jgi:AraC family transcriptional regulator, ethanolamine operon transcriptional activator